MVGRWVQAAAAQAGRLLVVLDLACQARVRVLCLDEIFLHREPVLMAIEPHSMAWMAGQRGPDRRGESRCDVITRWPCLEHVIADGGQGLERGVKLANAARGAPGEATGTVSKQTMTMGLDVLHTQDVNSNASYSGSGNTPSGHSTRRVRPMPRWNGTSGKGVIRAESRVLLGGPGARQRGSASRRGTPKRPCSRLPPLCHGLMPRAGSIAGKPHRPNSTRRATGSKALVGAKSSAC